jgi:hypothetical protein
LAPSFKKKFIKAVFLSLVIFAIGTLGRKLLKRKVLKLWVGGDGLLINPDLSSTLSIPAF